MQKFPLINFASSFFQDNQLENYYIIGVQHILGTTHEMFKALFKKGLKPENLSLIGKCYSTIPSVYESMKLEGIDVCESSLHFDSHLPFDIQFKHNIYHFLHERREKLNSSQFSKIIILDDGGELLENIDDFLERTENVVGIEQTSSGYNKLVLTKPSIPIVNLARADLKKTMETPFIVDAALMKIMEKIKILPSQPENVLIIGNGVIGSKIYSMLKDEYRIARFDLDVKKSDFSPEEFELHLGDFDAIIGCTGKTSVSQKYHHLIKEGCVLISSSSSDREFDAIHLRKKAPRTRSCFEDIVVNGVHLLNSGFPINFTGQNETEDLKLIQLTRALIISSIFQATEGSYSPGLIEMNQKIQDRLAIEFSNILRMAEEALFLPKKLPMMSIA